MKIAQAIAQVLLLCILLLFYSDHGQLPEAMVEGRSHVIILRGIVGIK